MTQQNPTVLIVDDEEDLRLIQCELFAIHGFTVFEAENGLKALEIIGMHNIDAVVSDVRMPKFDGFALLKALRQKNPQLPIVILVSGDSEIAEVDVVSLGATKLLNKPFDTEYLIGLVKEEIAKA